MGNSSKLYQSVFKKEFSNPGTRSFLKEVTDRHPYFSPAQFYLLKKQHQEADIDAGQIFRTNLLFNDPFWLNYLLQENNEIPEEKTLQTDADESVSETADGLKPMHFDIDLKAIENNSENAISFEPLHTSDYFASQGIKLSETVAPSDKLGVQLKSFTQWLKTMKKIQFDISTPETAKTESNVQQLAEKSNAEEETLTETMAEILVQQGKSGKAIEVYQKLSLLNPAKNHYFAAKIDQLKG